MNNKNLDAIFKIGLLIGFLLMSFGLCYFLVYFIPKQKMIEAQDRNIKKSNLEYCLKEAEDNKPSGSFYIMKKIGANGAGPDKEDIYREMKKDCYIRFK